MSMNSAGFACRWTWLEEEKKPSANDAKDAKVLSSAAFAFFALFASFADKALALFRMGSRNWQLLRSNS
jgi:hypothetical protein